MQRRHLLSLLAGAVAVPALAHLAPARRRLGIAWRGAQDSDPHHIGIIEVDWSARTLHILGSTPVPTRPHGLWPAADGGLLAVAARPGRWLMRLSAAGRAVDQVDVQDEPAPRRLAGHVVASPDGQRLYTSETDLVTGRGRIGVRDARSLQKLDDWDSHGTEPHQVLVDATGNLMIANGGITRDATDRKRDLHRMDASLVRLDAERGGLTGQWNLSDPRLSLRHLAWDTQGRLGIALQAEHEAAEDRANAPALALWQDEALRPITGGAGHAGDIVGVPGGGFVISNALRDAAWWWNPAAPDQLVPVAQLHRASALASSDGVLIAASRGLARWHPHEPAVMLPWPQAMALDNHMVTLLPSGDSAGA